MMRPRVRSVSTQTTKLAFANNFWVQIAVLVIAFVMLALLGPHSG
jgi:hypothetical protein